MGVGQNDSGGLRFLFPSHLRSQTMQLNNHDEELMYCLAPQSAQGQQALWTKRG